MSVNIESGVTLVLAKIDLGVKVRIGLKLKTPPAESMGSLPFGNSDFGRESL
jgi:hypothetical protein